MRIKSNCTLNSFLKGSCIKIGRYTGIGDNCELYGNVEIGKYCDVSRNVTFQGTNHVTFKAGIQARFYDDIIDNKLGHTSKGQIKIGNDVWIGAKAIILSGVKIDDGAIVGAGAVVTKDVNAYSISVGNPAVHKKYRFPKNIRNQLLRIKWWNWNEEKIKKNKEFFQMDLTKISNLERIVHD